MSGKVLRIKLWEQYTSDETFTKFKELHEYAMGCLQHAMDTGVPQKDEEAIAHELLMNLLGPDIWKIYNPYLE